jgi:hypothetical protein
MQESADLSAKINELAGSRNDYYINVKVARNKINQEYIFIGQYGNEQARTLVYSTNLKFLKEYWIGMNEIIFSDVNENFILGDKIINISSDFPQGFSKASSSTAGGFSYNNENIIIPGFNSNSNLYIDKYLPDWTNPVNLDTGSYRYITEYAYYQYFTPGAVFYNPLTNMLGFLLFSESSERFFLHIPAPDIAGAAPSTPLFDNYPYFNFGDIETKELHYTSDGIIVKDYKGRNILYSFTGKEKDSLEAYDSEYNISAYDIAGNYFYVFNKKTRILSKCVTWWK